MTSLVTLHADYLASNPILADYLLQDKQTIPCSAVPFDMGPYLSIVPAVMADTGLPSAPSEASFDGAFRVPHAAVLLIVDGAEERQLGFFAQTSAPPSPE